MRASHDPVSRLIFELSKLPGIGEKSATRLAYFILRQDEGYARSLSEAVLAAKQRTGLCDSCFTFTESSPCSMCQSTERKTGTVCVVERPSDVMAIEQSGSHNGQYHVLHGALSPLDGIGPDELKIRELLTRIQSGNVQEVILATNPSVEGEATAMYVGRLVKPFGVKVTKLAHGIPVGGTLEYSSRKTIGKALQNRVEVMG